MGMFEDQTFDVILARMLARVPDDVDKRPGSIIYDALAPSALEQAELYRQMDAFLELHFADTSNGEWLRKRTSEFGVDWLPASPAVRAATFNISVDVGARFFVDDLFFVVTKAGTNAEVTCETAGTVGNTPLTGTRLIPVETIDGLTSAILGDVLIVGEDEESDDDLKNRFAQRTDDPPSSGNKSHYVEWAQKVAGVGKVLVFPLWKGRGTVKVLILDANGNPATPELIADVQELIGETPDGDGEAPIGATVTVATATNKSMEIVADVVEDGSRPLADIQADFEVLLDDYLKKITEDYYDKKTNQIVVRMVKVGALLTDVAGVTDYNSLTINGGTVNITLAADEIPVKGTVTIT